MLKNLKDLLHLAEARIQAAHGNPQRLQRILSSLHQLQASQALPEFQKVSYDTLSIPYMTVSRFGIFPLGSPKLTAKDKSLMANRGASIQFKDKAIQGSLVIFGLGSILGGVLEIEIGLTAFKNFLGSYETVNFSPYPKNTRQVTNIPFPLYRKMPASFWDYALAHKSHYTIFIVYALLSVLFLGFYVRFLDWRLQKAYQSKFLALESACLKISDDQKALRKELGECQLEAQVHQIACQANKDVQFHKRERQQACANHIYLSLNLLQQSLKNPLPSRKGIDHMEILSSCLQEAAALAEGALWPMEKVQIDFKVLLDDLLLLFAEKVHKAAIRVELNIHPSSSPFFCDPLAMETLLINAIGKSIYRVPQNGTVFIELKEKPGFLLLEIQDNGFAGIKAAEKLIRKPFDLFMAEEVFDQACVSNGVKHESSKTRNGLNVTRLILPIPQEGIANSNVVQLFP